MRAQNTLLIIILIFCFVARGVSLRDRLNYESFQQVIKKNQKLITSENGEFIRVPFSPGVQKTTPLYFTFVTGYDKERPTLIFIPGGPGGSIHDTVKELTQLSRKFNVNVLAIDPRGTGLSRPEKASDYFSDQYISTHQSALDIESIRRQLNLKNVYLWARSYGTLTATIAASLFPGSYDGMILEGSLSRFQDFEIFRSAHTLRVEKFLESVSVVTNSESKKKLASMLTSAMYEYGSLKFEEYRAYILKHSQLGLDSLVKRLEQNFPEMTLIESIRSNALSFNLEIYNRIRLKDSTLDSAQYPTTVPTLYLQGEHDPVCFLEGALRHIKTSKNPHSQFFEFSKAGHHLMKFLKEDRTLHTQFLQFLVNGKYKIPLQPQFTQFQIEKFSANLPLDAESIQCSQHFETERD